MNDKSKLILALQQIDNLTNLLVDNQSKEYIYHGLITIKYELERQLTNITHQSKIKE